MGYVRSVGALMVRRSGSPRTEEASPRRGFAYRFLSGFGLRGGVQSPLQALRLDERQLAGDLKLRQ